MEERRTPRSVSRCIRGRLAGSVGGGGGSRPCARRIGGQTPTPGRSAGEAVWRWVPCLLQLVGDMGMRTLAASGFSELPYVSDAVE